MQARQAYEREKYDSDDQSSMVSEPGSPQDITMSDEDMLDNDNGAAFSQSPEDAFPSSATGRFGSSPWRAGMSQTDRVPTPIIPPGRLSMRSMQTRTGPKQHVRQRHPQENLSISSDHLEVPSPIDEDEVPTPPSAAEAAGSQLSMLTVNDMDMEPSEPPGGLPRISISPSSLHQHEGENHTLPLDSAIDMDTMDDTEFQESRLMVRKQRQRSGALSSGQGSPSPVRAELRGAMDHRGVEMGGAVKRVLSMGYRADCEKCRMRVPGHMNHFVS
jgi:hypothetical protein